MAEKILPIKDWSGGIQRKSSKFLKQENEVDLAINVDFSRIGAVQKVKGYSQKGNDVPAGWVTGDSTTSTGSSSTSTSTSTSTSSSSTSSSSTTTP